MATCLTRATDDVWQPDEVRFVLYDEPAMHAFEAPFRIAYKG